MPIVALGGLWKASTYRRNTRGICSPCGIWVAKGDTGRAQGLNVLYKGTSPLTNFFPLVFTSYKLYHIPIVLQPVTNETPRDSYLNHTQFIFHFEKQNLQLSRLFLRKVLYKISLFIISDSIFICGFIKFSTIFKDHFGTPLLSVYSS